MKDKWISFKWFSKDLEARGGNSVRILLCYLQAVASAADSSSILLIDGSIFQDSWLPSFRVVFLVSCLTRPRVRHTNYLWFSICANPRAVCDSIFVANGRRRIYFVFRPSIINSWHFNLIKYFKSIQFKSIQFN